MQVILRYNKVRRGHTAGYHGYMPGLPTVGVKYAARATPSYLFLTSSGPPRRSSYKRPHVGTKRSDPTSKYR